MVCVTFLSDIKKISAKSNKKKVIEIIKTCRSEQIKKLIKVDEKVFM